MNVLVVEDIPDVALTFAALIRAYGHRTQVAYDGASALQMVREFKPHTVFIDIHLPDMYGYDLAQQLRCVPGLEEALFVSVSGNQIDEEKWKQSSLDRHLQKPLTVDSLMGILEPREVQRSAR
jgi:CheY-like chemotaxis protein